MLRNKFPSSITYSPDPEHVLHCLGHLPRLLSLFLGSSTYSPAYQRSLAFGPHCPRDQTNSLLVRVFRNTFPSVLIYAPPVSKSRSPSTKLIPPLASVLRNIFSCSLPVAQYAPQLPNLFPAYKHASRYDLQLSNMSGNIYTKLVFAVVVPSRQSTSLTRSPAFKLSSTSLPSV
jgi:hypothetical protein